MLNCDINTIREKYIREAKKVFLGNSTSIYEKNGVLNIIVGSSKFITSKYQAFKVAKSNSDRVEKWARSTFGDKFSKGWTTIYTSNKDSIEVEINMPGSLTSSIIRQIDIASLPSPMTSFTKDNELSEQILREITELEALSDKQLAKFNSKNKDEDELSSFDTSFLSRSDFTMKEIMDSINNTISDIAIKLSVVLGKKIVIDREGIKINSIVNEIIGKELLTIIKNKNPELYESILVDENKDQVITNILIPDYNSRKLRTSDINYESIKTLVEEMNLYILDILNIDKKSVSNELLISELAESLSYGKGRIMSPGYENKYKVLDKEFYSYEEAKEYNRQLINKLYNLDSDTDITDSAIEDFRIEYNSYINNRTLVELWNKLNEISHDPDEIYSRGEAFYYNTDELGLQKVLSQLDDVNRDGREVIISTSIRDSKNIEELRLRFYPKSEDIKWTSSSSMSKPWEISPSIITNASTAGIKLNNNNFRVEYPESASQRIKDLADDINSFMDTTYGRPLDKAIVNPNFKSKISFPKYSFSNELTTVDPELTKRLKSSVIIKAFHEFIENNISDNKILDNKINPQIKEGVPELFESNPELANSVYEALGVEVNNFKLQSNKKAFGEPHPEGANSYDIFYKGNKIGKIVLFDGRNPMIKGLELNESERNKGLGKALYKWLNYKANLNGGTLYADQEFISPSAQRVWESLNKEGLVDLTGNAPKFNNQQKQQALRLYSSYLDTIFPDSKVKDIVYHGSIYSNKQKFKESTRVTGYYFATTPKEALQHAQRQLANPGDATLYYILLNIKKPRVITKVIDYEDLDTEAKFTKGDELFYDGADGIVAEQVEEYNTTYKTPESTWIEKQIVVFEPEQIHILSSKKDLEMFRNFVNFTKSEYAKYGDIQQFRDYIMSKNFADIEEFLVVNNKIDRKC